MAQQRTWKQRRQDAYQLRLLQDAHGSLRKEKESCVWNRHHGTPHLGAAEARYETAHAAWDVAVENWLSYCRRTGLDGNVVEIYHP